MKYPDVALNQWHQLRSVIFYFSGGDYSHGATNKELTAKKLKIKNLRKGKDINSKAESDFLTYFRSLNPSIIFIVGTN